MGFVNKRAGFGTLQGALSPQTIVSYSQPLAPKAGTTWLNKLTGEQKFWDGSAWLITSVVNQKTDLQVKIWIGSEAEYAAIVTKDDNTLYFCYA